MPDPKNVSSIWGWGSNLYWEVRHSFPEEVLFKMRPER